jgi:hypothetical protein
MLTNSNKLFKNSLENAAIEKYIPLAGSLRIKVLRLEIFDKLSDFANSLRSNNAKYTKLFKYLKPRTFNARSMLIPYNFLSSLLYYNLEEE